MYHTFTDNKNVYVKSRKEANKVVLQWKKEGFKNIRIYKEVVINEENDEVLVYAKGDFPW